MKLINEDEVTSLLMIETIIPSLLRLTMHAGNGIANCIGKCNY